MVRAGSPTGPRRGILQPGYARMDINWSLTTTSTTANQQIGSVAPAAGCIFKIQAIIIEVYFTTLSTTAAYLGIVSVRWGTDTIFGPFMASNTSSGALFGMVVPIPDEGMEDLVEEGYPLNAVCTPASATSTVWRVTIIGYERD